MTGHPTSEEPLVVTQDGPTVTVWLNRPGKRNAMSLNMWLALEATCRSLKAETRILIVRGVGGHFCAGADLSSVGDRSDIGYAEANHSAEVALASVAIPTVAYVSGSCVGGGVQIAAACDLRVCDATARFGVTPARFGIIYPPSALERVVRLLGPARTKRLVYSAELIDAATALSMGLVDDVYETDEADECFAQFVTRLTTRSLFTQIASKQMIDAISADGIVRSTLAEYWQNESGASPDAQEGIVAFLENRAPNFTWTPRGETSVLDG